MNCNQCRQPTITGGIRGKIWVDAPCCNMSYCSAECYGKSVCQHGICQKCDKFYLGDAGVIPESLLAQLQGATSTSNKSIYITPSHPSVSKLRQFVAPHHTNMQINYGLLGGGYWPITKKPEAARLITKQQPSIQTFVESPEINEWFDPDLTYGGDTSVSHTLAKDLMTSLSSNRSPNVATAIFMPRTSPSPLSRSQAPSPSALG